MSLIFFFEVLSPGWATKGKILTQMGIQALFIPAFIIFPNKLVLSIALSVAYGGCVVSLIFMCLMLSRHRKYIRDNYSYTEHVDVAWAVNCVVVLFVCVTVYVITSSTDTWLSRAVLHLILMGAWIYLNQLARRHSVVKVPQAVMFAFPLIKKHNDGNEAVELKDDVGESTEMYLAIARQLEACMNEHKLYLNPKLTLQEVSAAIGTNRTYLSDYLNSVLNTTFYEYVNKLRVRAACELIESMTLENKRSMLEISELSGFNSISTFNRSFIKIMGQTPSGYYAMQNKACPR